MVKSKAKYGVSIVAFVAATTLLPQASIAQTSAKDKDGEVVVTAQRREQRLQDVPVSVSVVSGASLENRNITSLQDLSASLPNVKITSAPAADQLNVRGVGSGLNAGFEQSVATFVDGVYRGRSRASRAAMFDIDRVEILKGPQTTFFGNNAIAGALNITTKKPGREFSYNANALYGSDEEYSLEGGVTMPIGETLSVRAAARFSGMDGYTKNTFTKQNGPNTEDVISRVSVSWQPSDNFRSDLRYDYARLKQDGYFLAEISSCNSAIATTQGGRGACANYLNATGSAADTAINNITAQPGSFSDYEMNEFALSNRWDIGEFTLNTITSYFEHDVDTLVNLIPSPVPGVGGIGALAPLRYPEKYHQFSQEVRLSSPKDRKFEYMVGLYYSSGKLDTDQYFGFYWSPIFVTGIPGTPLANNSAVGLLDPFGHPITAATPVVGNINFSQKDQTASAFASGTWHATDRLTFNLGLRYSEVTKRASRSVIQGTDNAIPGPEDFRAFSNQVSSIIALNLGSNGSNFAKPKRTDIRFMPSINVQYEISPEIMTYISYNEGFKAGGYGAASSPDIFEPEYVKAYEAGLKGTFMDRHLFTAITAFRSDYQNLQESVNLPTPGGSLVSVIKNVAEARASGIELSANYRFNSHVRLNVDVAWLAAKYTNYTNAPCAFVTNCTQDLSGRPKAFSPNYSGNLGLNIKFPVANNEIRFDPTIIFTDGYYQQATIDKLFYQDANVKFDARLAYGPASRNWEIAIIGRNLTDETTASFRNNLTSAPGSIWAIADRPRSVALQLSIKH